MRASGERLLRRAQDAGQVRTDITVYEMIAIIIGSVWAVQQDGGLSDRMARLLDVAAHGFVRHPTAAGGDRSDRP
jgi:hypothetical protein